MTDKYLGFRGLTIKYTNVGTTENLTMHRRVLMYQFVIFISSISCIQTAGYLRTIALNITSQLKTIAVDDVSGDVYIGGVGVVAHLSGNLTSISQWTFGKNGTDMIPKDISLLLIYKRENKLLSCGTFEDGLCRLHVLKNVSKIARLNPKKTTNYLGSNGTAVAIRIPEIFSRRCMVAVESIKNVVPNVKTTFISTRKLRLRSRRQRKFIYEIRMASEIKSAGSYQYSGLDVHSQTKNEIFMQPIYAFTWKNFAYFLIVQKNPRTKKMQTKVARTCLKDNWYHSYVELKIRCFSKLNYFEQATAGHYSDGYVYISFVPADVSGTALCRFSLDELNAAFNITFTKCFNFGLGQQPFWMSSDPLKCELNHRSGPIECGKMSQRGLTSLTTELPLSNSSFFETREQVKAMASVRTSSGKSVVLLGTSTGYLKKVFVNPPEGHPQEYFSIQVTGSTDVGFEASMTLNGNLLYGLAGNKVIQFDISSCSVYKTCDTCLTNQDLRGCGWCDKKCMSSAECLEVNGHFSNRSCTPSIHSIHPLDGPISGGTDITIKGDYFGWSNSNHFVLVAGSTCTVREWYSKQIKCTTVGVDRPVRGVVEVVVRDLITNAIRPYAIDGRDRSAQTFSFKEPIIKSYYPTYGPMSGGTLVTFHGENLDVGNSRIILVGHHQCVVFESTFNSLKCKTEANRKGLARDMIFDKPSTTERIFVYVDSFNLNGGRNFTFEYKPDPIVTGISPKTSFYSGGVTLTVFGTNLDSVADPLITYEAKSKHYQPCEVKQEGSVMMCKVPPLPSSTSNELKLHFILDDAKDETCETITYLSDPVIFPFQDRNRTRLIEEGDNAELRIMGDKLSSRFTAGDVHVLIGETTCRVVSVTETDVTCVPSNTSSQGHQTYPVAVTIGNLEFHPGSVCFFSREESSWMLIIICVVPIVLTIIIVVIVWLAVIKWRRNKRQNPIRAYMSQQSIIYRVPDILVTPETDDEMSMDSLDDLDFKSKSFDRLMSSTLTLFHKDNLIIHDSHLVIQGEIGKGNFGCVYRGTYLNPEGDAGAGSMEVAVKTLKQKAPDEKDLNMFLEEALIMKDFCHENVLRLVGVCLAEDAVPYVVLPFMRNGDLLSYVRNIDNNPTIRDLMLFGIDVARGMEYLTKCKFVHRDLAARNCMLDANLRVKVADFGLTRDVYVQEYYSCKDHTARLPIKWMALESIQKGTFTSMSDVWSYGVLLWELMTRGISPYGDVDVWDMQRYLMSGRRLARPEYCPLELYDLMKQCWDANPRGRITFSRLVLDLPALLEDLEKQDEDFSKTSIDSDKTINRQSVVEGEEMIS